jgi:replication factor A1
MVQIATKYDVEPLRLVDAFRSAWEDSTAECGRLRIACRKTSPEAAMFRITCNEHAIWQYPVNIGSINNPGAGDVMKHTLASRPPPIPTHQNTLKIGQLTSGMKNLMVHARITKIPPGRGVMTRWGEQASISNATIADDTGSIRLSLWNNQITTFHVGDEIEIHNCYVTQFAGELQLRVKRKGRISISPIAS